ncbi:MAG: hypothetical protein RLY43_780 [Bacteroidota bacterium]|jgi:hypothetical protein
MDAIFPEYSLDAFLTKYKLKNKTCAMKHISNLLNTLPEKIELSEPILYDLLKLHPYYGNVDPDFFFIQRCSKFNTKCFWFYDGTDHDFSYKNCFETHKNILKNREQMSFRQIGYPTINQFKTQKRLEHGNASFLCPLSGLEISMNSSMLQVDHDKHSLTHLQMINNFKNENNICNIIETVWDDKKGIYTFKDNELATKWALYHHQNASLQLVHRDANLSNKY